MPPTRSSLWNIFVKTSSGGRCKLCGHEVKTCGNTTNLKKHLIRRHPNYNVNPDENTSQRDSSKIKVIRNKYFKFK